MAEINLPFGVSGESRRFYVDRLIKSLEALRSKKTGMESEIDSIIELIQFFTPNDIWDPFKDKELKIDPESGLPLITSMMNLSIGKRKSKERLKKVEDEKALLDNIVKRCFENDFNLTSLQENLSKICFYNGLAELKLLYTPEKTILEHVKGEEDLEKYQVCLRGYDPTKMGWAKYIIGLFQKGDSSKLFEGNREGEKFEKIFGDCFSHGVETIYNLLRTFKNIRPTYIERYLIDTFLFEKTKNPEWVQETMAYCPKSSILIFEKTSIEDTDLSLSEELDKEVLSKNYKPKFKKEKKRIFVCNPEIEPIVEEFCSLQPYHTEVISI